MTVFFWMFLVLTALMWLGSWLIFARLRTLPLSRDDHGERSPSLSVVIPARNEEENLRKLLPCLQNQSTAPLEIIVVDDESEDDTSRVAEKHGARVIKSGSLPFGWYGKPWALTRGAEAAQGEWILFLDADTELEPNALARLTPLTKQENRVFSVCPWHHIERPYEELSAFFNVIMLLGINAFTIRGFSAKHIGLFGQVLLVKKSDYERVGGHESVKNVVLENLHLAPRFREHGIECCSFLGRGAIRMRMFPGGYDELVSGWAKGFVSGAGATPRGAMVGISGWLSSLIMVAISLSFLPFASTSLTIFIVVLYLLGALQCLYLFRQAGSFSIWNALFFPVSLFFYQGLFFRSARRSRNGQSVQWKGRHVT